MDHCVYQQAIQSLEKKIIPLRIKNIIKPMILC